MPCLLLRYFWVIKKERGSLESWVRVVIIADEPVCGFML